jgi:hypothetical protein
MGFPAVGVAGVGAPPACVGEVPLPQPVHKGTAVRACRQFQDELGVHVIGIGRIPFGCHGVALLGAPRRPGERIPNWGPGPGPEEGDQDPGQGLTTRRRKHTSVGDTSPARGAPRASSPCRLSGYGTNRPETAVAVSAIDSGRVACDCCNGRTQVIPHPRRAPTAPGSCADDSVGAPDLTVRSAGRPRSRWDGSRNPIDDDTSTPRTGR